MPDTNLNSALLQSLPKLIEKIRSGKYRTKYYEGWRHFPQHYLIKLPENKSVKIEYYWQTTNVAPHLKKFIGRGPEPKTEARVTNLVLYSGRKEVSNINPPPELDTLCLELLAACDQQVKDAEIDARKKQQEYHDKLFEDNQKRAVKFLKSL